MLNVMEILIDRYNIFMIYKLKIKHFQNMKFLSIQVLME